MKGLVSLLIVIMGIVTILSLPNAYSDLTSNNKYLIQANGYLAGKQTIAESTIALQLTAGAASGSNIPATLDNGLVTISNVDYLNSGSWQTTMLRDGKFFVITGDAQDQNGNTINLNLFGRLIDTSQDGSVYSISGKITGTEAMKVTYSAKVTTVGAFTAQPVPTTTPTTQTPPQTNTINVSILRGSYDIHKMDQRFFSPSSIQIVPGTTIVWANDDSVPHQIMSGVASAIGAGSQLSFTSDGVINSGIIKPGESFQFTIHSLGNKTYVNAAVAQMLHLSPDQIAGTLTFYDPTYPWMTGAITQAPATTTQNIAQITILQGASTANNGQFISPSTLQITPGTTIVFKNSDSAPHRIQSGQSMTITEGGKGAPSPHSPQFTPDRKIDSGVIAPGQTHQITINGVGTTVFFDPSNMWINGVITSVPKTQQVKPIQISIQLGSSLSQGSASQQNQFYTNGYYSPTDVQIVPGTAIIWVNNDSVAHKILSGTSTQKIGNPFTPDGMINSGVIAPGASFQAIINGTGIIRFYDPDYTWMNGVIVSIPTSSSFTIGATSHNLNLH